MNTITNDTNTQLYLQRTIKKVTRQAIHTTNGEVLKFKDGWRELAITEKQNLIREGENN